MRGLLLKALAHLDSGLLVLDKVVGLELLELRGIARSVTPSRTLVMLEVILAKAVPVGCLVRDIKLLEPALGVVVGVEDEVLLG